MPGRIIKILVVLHVFLFANFFYLSAQDKEDVRENAQQNYLNGQDLSSPGRMREPSTEVEEVAPISIPRTIEFTQRVEQAQGKIVAPPPSKPDNDLLALKEKEKSKKKKLQEKEKEGKVTEPVEIVAGPGPVSAA